MSDRSIDRHKSKRVYKSGYNKIIEKKEKETKTEKLLSQTHRMTDFFRSDHVDRQTSTQFASTRNENHETYVSKKQ